MLLPSFLGLALFKLQTASLALLSYPFHTHDELLPSTSETTRFDDLRREYAIACPEHHYRTHIFSRDPLIIYIENYLLPDETRYLLDLA